MYHPDDREWRGETGGGDLGLVFWGEEVDCLLQSGAYFAERVGRFEFEVIFSMLTRYSTVFMTGTPGGVGCFMDPPQYLKHGDQIDVEINGIGTLRNKIIFE